MENLKLIGKKTGMTFLLLGGPWIVILMRQHIPIVGKFSGSMGLLHAECQFLFLFTLAVIPKFQKL